MRAVIIDDETDVHKVITTILVKRCPHVNVVGTATSVKAGVQLLQQLKPELVFLDIKMPGGTGFDILEKITDMKMKIIFVTAYDEYAIRAIKSNALDYIMKPIHSQELVNAVSKVAVKTDQESDIMTMIRQLSEGSKERKLIVNSIGKVYYLDLDSISHIESDGAYSKFQLIGGKEILSSKSIKDYEMELADEAAFYRAHRSHIVNLAHVLEYVKRDSGDEIKLKGGTSIAFYRKKRKEFLDAMERFNES